MAPRPNPYEDFHQQCIAAAQDWQKQLPSSLNWLNDERSASLGQFKAMSLPTRKTESWKYTPISAIVQNDILRLKEPLNDQLASETRAGVPLDGDFYQLRIVNGQLQQSTVDDEALEVIPFSTSMNKQQSDIRQHLNKTFCLPEHPFAALNACALQDGVMIRVRANKKPAKPVMISHINNNVGQGYSSYSRVLIVVETGAKATLIESFNDPKSQTTSMTNVISEISLADNSSLTHYALNTESQNHIHTGAVFVEQQSGSQFIQHNFATGGKLKRRDIQIKLLGPNAFCKLWGAYLIGGKSHVDYHTAIDHVAPHCNSEENFKGIVTDQGKAVFNGRIHIHRDAQQSNADMNNKNLLLTNSAEVNTKPELEIYADDVKCAHGATVGQLDETALFYFQSRGISRADAHRMLSHAFIEVILDEMDLDTVKEHIESISEAFYDSPELSQNGPELKKNPSGQESAS